MASSTNGDGPPAHWLEKARPAEPPAFWLEAIRRLTADGGEPRPFAFSAPVGRPVDDAEETPPEQPSSVTELEPDTAEQSEMPFAPVDPATPVADVRDSSLPVPPATDRRRTANDVPRPASARSVPEPARIVQPIAFPTVRSPKPEAEKNVRTASVAPNPNQPSTELPRSVDEPQPEPTRTSRNSLYGYLPLPQYDPQILDTPTAETLRQSFQTVPRRETVPIPWSPPPSPAPTPLTLTPPSINAAPEPTYQRLLVTEEGIWPELMDDPLEDEPDDHGWDRMRRLWARRERLDREQRGLPRLD